MRRSFLLAVFGLLLAASPSFARTWIVDPDGNGDYLTIWLAISRAASSDTVEIVCGTYVEPGLVLERPLVIRSASGFAGCVTIDARNEDRAFTAIGVGGPILLEGITLTNGITEDAPYESRKAVGGGIYVERCSDFRLNRCVLVENFAHSHGGGLGAFDSDVRITDCEIVENRAMRVDHIPGPSGGGIFASGGSLEILDSELRDNAAESFLAAGGALFCRDVAPTLDRCLIAGNRSDWTTGGLFLTEGGEVRDSVIRDNKAGVDGSGGILSLSRPAILRVTDCLFTGNWSPGGCALVGDALEVERCTIVGHEGTAIALVFASSIVSEISNTIVAHNGGAALSAASDREVDVRCTNLFGNAGGDWKGVLAAAQYVDGNLSADPLFCDPESGVFTLQSDSPCAPSGSEGCGLIGALPVGCGPVSAERASWGKIRERYR